MTIPEITNEEVDKLVDQLCDFSSKINFYEYGLPKENDDLRAIVKAWAYEALLKRLQP